jgi:hypothetical protein
MDGSSIPDWISSIAAAVGALAVVFGLFRADKKVDEVQANARILKRAEVAEDLIALALNVEDAMKDIRNPIDSVPKDMAGDARFGYQRRYDRVVKYNDLFRRLREAQIRERTIIGDAEVNEAVETLFDVRNEVAVSIELLADHSDESPVSAEDRESRLRLRRVVFGSFSEKDEIGKRVTVAVQTIESKLKPFARLDVPRSR